MNDMTPIPPQEPDGPGEDIPELLRVQAIKLRAEIEASGAAILPREVSKAISLMNTAADIIEQGKRIDTLFRDTLNDTKDEYFNIAVQAAKEAETANFLPRRAEARELSENAKNKVRYILNVLAYDGSTPLGERSTPK